MRMMNHEFGESSSSSSESCVYNLTEDLVIEILLRLPVIDVIRMKRVCNSLYSFINSSDFIAKHSLLDGDRDPYMFISIPFKGTRVVSVSYDDDDDDDDTSTTTGLRRKRGVIHIRPTSTRSQPQAHRLFCCCSCDGVLLVSFAGVNNRAQLALWNPATGDIKDIPTYDHYKNLSDDSDDGEEEDLCVTNYGCGFDSKNNEYRPFFVLSDKYYSFKTEIEIYSYKNKIWKIIQSSGIISHGVDMVYAHGFCHWPGFSRLIVGPNSNGRDVIVSFDITNEHLEFMLDIPVVRLQWIVDRVESWKDKKNKKRIHKWLKFHLRSRWKRIRFQRMQNYYQLSFHFHLTKLHHTGL